MSELFLNLAYEDTHEDPREFDRFAENERRYGPCEDSHEVTCAYLDMLPEESDHEHGSPLNFRDPNEGFYQRSARGQYPMDPYWPQPVKR